eukprot:COSAG01_NODE_582_length_15201_cov_7.218315_21_plen_86_part_00
MLQRAAQLTKSPRSTDKNAPRRRAAEEARSDRRRLEQRRRAFHQCGLGRRKERVAMQLQAHLEMLRGLWVSAPSPPSARHPGCFD